MMSKRKRRAPAKIYTEPHQTLIALTTHQIAEAERQLAIAPTPELEAAIAEWRLRLAQLIEGSRVESEDAPAIAFRVGTTTTTTSSGATIRRNGK